jgi:hypothetical protein
MLPREMSKVLAAVNESTETQIDVARLRTELAGTAEFYRALVRGDLLTDQQRELFAAHVGKHIDLGRKAPRITEPYEGPPKVHVFITAPNAGAPSVGSRHPVKCPNCKFEFTPKS